MLHEADAVVVLGGGGIHWDGQLSEASLRRVRHGIGLFQQGLAPLLVLSGSRGETAARAELARSVGITPHSIIIEDRARTTREEALRLAEILHPLGLRSLLLVVDAQGSRRAAAVFTALGFDVLPAPAEDISGAPDTPAGRLQLMRRVVLEAMAYAYYVMVGYL